MPGPNLVFIFTDEQRADTMAAYGNDRIHTPYLNRLAMQSVIFDRAYVTQPICTPSRSSLLTGLYPHTNGCTRNNVPLRADTPCFPEMLPPGAYATAYYGKWHLGDEIFAQHGFDDWRSIEDQYREYYGPGRDRHAHSTYHDFLTANGLTPSRGEFFERGETARFPERFSKPAYLAGEASRFIEANKDRPFVLFVNFLEPHMPFFGPRDGQYDPAEVSLPANFDAVPGEGDPLRTRIYYRRYYEQGYDRFALRTEADWRRLIANYWGLCSLVDTHLGAILETLDRCGLAGNTIVVYTSDHGDMMGSHRLLHKGFMYEESVRVPLLMRVPGARPGRVARPVSQIDLVPTLLDLMGERVPAHLEGKSLRPDLEGSGDPRQDVFVEWTDQGGKFLGVVDGEPMPAFVLEVAEPERALQAIKEPVRTVITSEGWKLNWRPSGEHELFDLRRDPGETRNLATSRRFHPLIRELAGKIRGWQRNTDDTVDIC